MNTLNYATLPASKRLVEAGIVLETEAGWYKIFRPGCHAFDMVLSMRSGNENFFGDNYPAPCMAEVWRELLDDSLYLGYTARSNLTYAGRLCGAELEEFHNTNPTDALIDLLIWVRKEADHDSDRP